MSDTADSGLAEDRLDLVLFSAAGWMVGIDSAQVSGAWPATSAMAGSCTAVSALIGLPGAPEDASQEGRRHGVHLLSLKQPEEDVVIDQPVEFVSISLQQVHPLPPLLAARSCLNGLRGLAMDTAAAAKDTRLVLLFDATAWGLSTA